SLPVNSSSAATRRTSPDSVPSRSASRASASFPLATAPSWTKSASRSQSNEAGFANATVGVMCLSSKPQVSLHDAADERRHRELVAGGQPRELRQLLREEVHLDRGLARERTA